MNQIIGVISDTHGLLRPEAIEALQGYNLIVHAGDIGHPKVLEGLRTIAPVIAVRGNIDRGDWANTLAETEKFERKGYILYVLHDINQLELDPAAAKINVVIAGHSHQPKNDKHDGIMFFNPVSAGPKRFKLPVCVGKICLKDQIITAEHIELID